MSVFKKEIRLICESIDFTFHSIVYKVRADASEDFKGVVSCVNDIKDKDLILKPTIVSKDSLEVIFNTLYVAPHFYQNILNKSLRNLSEYKEELDKIYVPGDVVGYVLQEFEVKKTRKKKSVKENPNQFKLNLIKKGAK